VRACVRACVCVKISEARYSRLGGARLILKDYGRGISLYLSLG